MLVGYARVSTLDQNLDLQTDSLETAGCERIFTDRNIRGSCRSTRASGCACILPREGGRKWRFGNATGSPDPSLI